MLDVRRLRLLRDLAHLGTIAAVAQAHAYTPSAVSQQLAALQREAGVPLLEHIGRGVTLTPAARLSYSTPRRCWPPWKRPPRRSRPRAPGCPEPCASGRSPAPSARCCPRPWSRWAATIPALDLRVTELDPVAMPGALRDQSLDVALLHDYDITPARPDPALDSVPLLDEAVFLAVPEGGRPRPGGPAGSAGAAAAPGPAGPEPRLDRRQPGHALPRRRHADLRDRRLRAQGPPSGGRLRRRARAGRRRAGRRAGPAARGRAATPGVRLVPLPVFRRTRLAYRRGAGTHPVIAACVQALRLSTRGYLRRRDGSVRDGGS